MDKLLDKEVHQSYKAPSLVNYLSCKQTGAQPQPQPMTPGPSGCQPHPSTPQACPAPTRASELDEIPLTDQPPEPHRGPSGLGGACGEPQPGQKQSPTTPGGGGARPKTTYTLRYGNRYGRYLVVASCIFTAAFQMAKTPWSLIGPVKQKQ